MRPKEFPEKITISAVSYLNTKPFLFGIEKVMNKNDIELSVDIPSECANKVINGRADVGLVPVAVLPLLKGYRVITEFGIAANGKVASVLLFANCDLHNISEIMLDYQSRTSVELVKILAKEKWNISPEWTHATPGYEQEIGGSKAAVVIGDRSFHLKGHYKTEVDLAEEWKSLTGLPMVFAVWVANDNVSNKFVHQLNEAFIYGIENTALVVKNLKDDCGINLSEYYTTYVKYQIGKDEKKAIELFISKI